jgi:hypothetical protein
MPANPIELPPEVERAFRDMRAFFATPAARREG